MPEVSSTRNRNPTSEKVMAPSERRSVMTGLYRLENVTDEREILTYELFGTAARELAQRIWDDGFRPDAIVAIARGGLTLAGALGYALDVKMLGSLNVEFYTGVEERL